MASKRKVINENMNMNQQENDDEGSSSSSPDPPNELENESGEEELNAYKKAKLNENVEGDAESPEVEVAEAVEVDIDIGPEAAIRSAAEIAGPRPNNDGGEGRPHVTPSLQTALAKISNPIKDNLINGSRMGGVLVLFNERGLDAIVDRIQTYRNEWAEMTPRIVALFDQLDRHWEALSANAIAVLESNNVRYEVDSVTNMLVAFEPSVVTLVELGDLPEVQWIKGPTMAYSIDNDEIDMDGENADADDEDDDDDDDHSEAESDSNSEASGVDTDDDDSDDDEEEEVVYAN